MDEFMAFCKAHKWRIIVITLGIVLAILLFTIGFWRTLLLLLIVAVCYGIGMLLDIGGRAKLKEAGAALVGLFGKKS